MTNEKAIMCLEDMKIKVPIPKAAKQARENNEALDVAIKALQNVSHWIPVTERLPKSSGLYLVTEDWYGDREIHTRYYNKRKEGESFWSGHPNQTVHAWMPLPEPYKGVTE